MVALEIVGAYLSARKALVLGSENALGVLSLVLGDSLLVGTGKARNRSLKVERLEEWEDS